MAVFAKNCPDIEIDVVDVNPERIKGWNNNDLTKLPVFEPGLSQIIKEVTGHKPNDATLKKAVIEISKERVNKNL